MSIISRLAQAIGGLKQPSGDASPVPRPAESAASTSPVPKSPVEELMVLDRAEAMERLRTDFGLFCRVLEQLASEFNDRPEVRFSHFTPDIEARIDQAARELRESGLAYWPGFFTNSDYLARLARTCTRIRERSDELCVQNEDVIDPDLKWHYQARNAGRSRAIFPPPGSPEATPDEIKALLHNEIFNEVVGRAFKTKAEPYVVIPENVIPTTAYEEQWWHIDRVYEQAKIMVLASDVGPLNGPMKIIPGTHRFEGPRRALEFAYFREGADFSDVPISLARRSKKDVRLATGKPGDCIFFNTSAFHATGRADEGERLTATVYYFHLSTPRNDFLDRFNPGYHI